LFIVCAGTAQAQQIDPLLHQLAMKQQADLPNTIVLPREALKTEAVPCDPTELSRFQRDSYYHYNYNIRRLTLMERFQMWLNRMIFRMLGKTIAPGLLRTILVILGIIIVIAVIVVIIMKRSRFFYANVRKNLAYSIDDEDIENQDYDRLMMRAVGKAQYSEAIRWQFMKILQHLQRKNLISFDTYKTVNEYVYEIDNSNLRNKFKTLSYHFICHRYGGWEADRIKFEEFKGISDELIKSING
jgi:hypothetical protein